MRTLSRFLVVVSLVSVSVAIAAPARALFHLMKITEVFAGTSEQPAAQFIEMQMHAANQRFLASHSVVVYDAQGEEAGSFTFTGPVENGADQAYVLIATPEAEATFGVTADLAMDAVMIAGGGKVCFMSSQGDAVDCASWGGFSGDNAGSGTPFNSPVGLVGDRSMERDTSGGENPNGLDPGDDTDDSAADFQLASPSPTNNAGTASQTEEHERAVTLRLRERSKLVASGTVESEYAACAHDTVVQVQRKTSSGWKTVAGTETDGSGAYKASFRKKAGTYRSRVPASTPEEGHGCMAAVSPKRKT